MPIHSAANAQPEPQDSPVYSRDLLFTLEALLG